MKFQSTRGEGPVGLDDALTRGIAGDGGLYLPVELPRFEFDEFNAAHSARDVAVVLLQPFFADSTLADDLKQIVAETLSFPLPVTPLTVGGRSAWMLELFHGPTCAFKDVGAGFLAACLSRLHGDAEQPLVILVATSGDTGGAVAAAFDGRKEARVAVLFPAGRVSERQAKQLTCWSENVLSLEVRGSFDDCQAMVKAAFADSHLASRYRFSSANSINIGRLLPQATYYAYAALSHYREHNRALSFVVPTGNLGNALACVLARDMGLPIGDIVLATNENRLIPDHLAGAAWHARASIETLATAMDVGNPSNMERLRKLHGEGRELKSSVSAVSVTDAEIEAAIVATFRETGVAYCPHTATALHAFAHLDPRQRNDDWCLVATAHAAKFESVVEPLINAEVEVPDNLQALLSRQSRYQTIAPNLSELGDALDARFSA